MRELQAYLKVTNLDNTALTPLEQEALDLFSHYFTTLPGTTGGTWKEFSFSKVFCYERGGAIKRGITYKEKPPISHQVP
ncbi:hypothetical protein [Helicobacter gastrofelis]|uniref:hypothetical protein n=1 Tax=Helicobacter gastrofelis TaxID=2849642 RepID=UPI001C84D72C|nr:hypothetical protein [Helicobacter sp. NHP19-012]